jgi:hypothetical protein
MRGVGIKTRIVLIGVIVLILCGYGWWYFAPGKPVAPELEIEVSWTNVVPPDDQVAFERLPFFVPGTGDWLAGGKRMRSIAQFATWPARGQLPDDSVFQRFVPIRLPADADRATMQQALRALAVDGVCQVAMVERPGSEDMLVLVRSFSDAKGVSQPCRDRVNNR